MKMDQSKQETRIDQKLDAELFDEEIQILRSAVNERV